MDDKIVMVWRPEMQTGTQANNKQIWDGICVTESSLTVSQILVTSSSTQHGVNTKAAGADDTPEENIL